MIHIKDDWYIDCDSRNFNLCRRSESINKKTGEKEITYLARGYYASLVGCLLGYRDMLVRNKVHDESYESVCEAVNAVTQANKEVIDLLHGALEFPKGQIRDE